jgi:hypothetical protein
LRSNAEDNHVRTIREELVVRIPTDYATLQNAIDDLSGRILPRQGAKIILQIEAEHQPSSGIVVEGGDFGRFWIRGEDRPVEVSDSFTGAFLHGTYARLPVLDCLVNMKGRGEDGVHARESSSARIMPRAGILNAGQNGVFGWVSAIYMELSIVTGSTIDNLRVSNSQVHARHSNLSGAGRHNLRASYGSSVRATFADLSNAGDTGVYVARSRVIAEASNITNAGRFAVLAGRGSSVHIGLNHRQTDLSGAREAGIWARAASTVEGSGVKIHGAGEEGIRAEQNANVSLRGGDIRDCGLGISATLGASVDISHGIVLNSRNGIDLLATSGGTIVAKGIQTGHEDHAPGSENNSPFRIQGEAWIIFD